LQKIKVNDLELRLNFFNKWIERGSVPPSLWLPGFFFTHAVMTGSLQNYCRQHQHAIDHVEFGFTPFLSTQGDTNFDTKPDKGIYVYGFYVEGAQWSDIQIGLEESKPRVLYTRLPVLWMVPKLKISDDDSDCVDSSDVNTLYNCPLYNTSERRGQLSTTGHSTNFIMYLQLGSGKMNPDHWCKRGTACLMQLD
jgi:dynein heavy chain, axonemal